MSPSYEDGYEYNYHNPITPDYYEYVEPEPKTPGGITFVSLVFKVYLLLPLVVIFNLILLIKIVRTKKIRTEPWRWLVANTSFCMILTAVLGWNSSLTALYLVPSLMSSPVCYFFEFVNKISWHMVMVSFTLVITERFHALRMGVEDGGSFSKKQVLLCLVPFWLIFTLKTLLPPVTAIFLHKDSMFFENPDGRCFLRFQYEPVASFIIWLWSFPTVIVVFIGTLVLRSRKATTDSMKRSIVNPNLALSCIFFVCMSLPYGLIMSASLFPLTTHYVGVGVFYVINALALINNIIFPIIWLATWSRNGDISLKCSGGDNEERKRLLGQN